MEGINLIWLLNVIKLIFFIAWFPARVHGSCTFPSDIRGNWTSSEKGILNFTDSAMYNYKINNFFGRQQIPVFNCTANQGNLFLLDATISWRGIIVSLHLCIEFYKSTMNKYTYQVVNKYDTAARDRLYINNGTVRSTIGIACDRPRPLRISTSNILVQEDESTAEMCPFSLQHIFNDGGLNGVTCEDNLLDICQNRNYLVFIKGSSCHQMPTPTGGNSFACLHQMLDASSGLTYLYIQANSSSVVPRPINCMVFKATDTTLRGKIYPGSCDHNPSSNHGSTGTSINYRNTTKSCQDHEVVTPSIIGLIAGAAAGIIVLGLLIAAIVYIVKKKKYRCLTGRRKVGQSKKLLTSSQENMSVSSLSKDENLNLFVAKEPNKLGSVVIPDLHPPPYVELLYQVETKTMSNKQVFDKNTVFLSDLSLRSK